MAMLDPLFMDINEVYSGDEFGLPYRDLIGEGVVDLAGGHYEVTAGSGNTVDVAAGAAWVTGDTNPDRQPTYRCINDATVNLGISPDPSNPRKVLIIIQVTDEAFTGTGREAELQALHGTAAASPSDPALPDSALLLATLTVPAAAADSSAYTITDSRGAAALGSGNLDLATQSTIVATSVAGLGVGVDGAEGLIRVDLAEDDHVALIYDETYAQWVSEPRRQANQAMSNVPGSDTIWARMVISNYGALYDAGLRLQVRISGISPGTTWSVECELWEFNDGDTTLAQIGSDLAMDSGSGATYISTGWVDFDANPAEAHAYLYGTFTSSTNTAIGEQQLQLEYRWVGA